MSDEPLQRDEKGRYLPKPRTVKKKIAVKPSEHNLPVPRGFVVLNDEYVQVNATGKRLKSKPKPKTRRRNKNNPPIPKEYFYGLRKISLNFKTVSLPEDDDMRLQQLVRFYKMKSRPRMLSKLINETFEKAFKESLYLQAIHQRRQREYEAIYTQRKLTELQAAKLAGDPSGDLLPYFPADDAGGGDDPNAG